jgi:hypothetical protein
MLNHKMHTQLHSSTTLQAVFYKRVVDLIKEMHASSIRLYIVLLVFFCVTCFFLSWRFSNAESRESLHYNPPKAELTESLHYNPPKAELTESLHHHPPNAESTKSLHQHRQYLELTSAKNCQPQHIEILALDVGVDNWDWIEGVDCQDHCTFTPCCKQNGFGQDEYVCSSSDVLRADASTVHLEWLGVKHKTGGLCGRTCCQRWAELNLDTHSKILIGVQTEGNGWGYNTDPDVISSLTHLLTFQPANSEPFLWMKNRVSKPDVLQYEFAEPSWAFNSTLLSAMGGLTHHPTVQQWAQLAPGPSSSSAISFVQHQCKPLYYELAQRNLVIDSYGSCEHNRYSGFEMGSWQKNMYVKKLAILSGYMFDLAIENDIESSWWNTERMYHALLVHTIPIYQGSGTVFARIPHPDSIIYVNSFGGDMDALVAYIQNVATNATLRAKHMHWTTLHPSQWQNDFPQMQQTNSRLGGAMCKVCESLRASKLSQCEQDTANKTRTNRTSS